VLLESIVSISLITVIMAALAMLFVTVIKVDNQQRAKQAAIQVADSAVGTVRSYHTTDLVPGNTPAATIPASWSAAPTTVQPYLTSMRAADTSSTPSALLSVTPAIFNGVTYNTENYFGLCWVSTSSTSPSTDCTATQSAGSLQYLRTVVTVWWLDNHCPVRSATDSRHTCVYITSTMISTLPDPIFNLNQTPPAAPIVDCPPAQTSYAVGDTVSMQLNVKDGTGVPTFTWQVLGPVNLPPGLTWNTAGQISGVISGQVTSQSVTFQVTDAFARHANCVISWTVLPALVPTVPGPQASVTGSPITTLKIDAVGGAGAPYTWSDPSTTLPPGLSLSTVSNQAWISGTATTAKSTPYVVTLTVADSSGSRKKTVTFYWTVSNPPLALSTPPTQTDTVNKAISGLQLSVSGGAGPYTWNAGSTLPPGLSLSATGLVSGTPSTVNGYPVSVTVTDSQGASRVAAFTWNVVARPSVTAPTVSDISVGAPVSVNVISSCPNSPCTYSLNSKQPTGLTIDASGNIIGTVGGSAASYSGIIVTITDADGATANSSSFNWTVRNAPTVSSPGDQVNTTGGAVSVSLATTCPLPTCSYQLLSGPAGLTINSSGKITGSIGNAAGTSLSNVTIKVTDGAGSPALTAKFSWTITAAPTIQKPSDQLHSVGSPVSIVVTKTCPNSPCTYQLNNGPSGVAFDVNGNMTGTITGSAAVYNNASVTVTDHNGISVTSTPAFIWTIQAAGSIAAAWSTTSPNVFTTSKGGSPVQNIAYSCPDTKCTITVTGLPSGVGLSKTSVTGTTNSTTTLTNLTGLGTVYVTGKLTNSKTTTTVTFTLTNSAGSTVGTNSGSWQVS
jgi:type II secretory pathway pseudopilin PulG